MKTNEMLECVRVALNLNQAEFALKLDIQPGTYSGIKKNPPLELSKKLIYKLENELNVRKEFIETGNGEIFKNEINQSTININQTIETMNLETLNRMLSIIEKQQIDIHIANLNVKQAQENQFHLIKLIPGGVQMGEVSAG